ncbi:hypothetical protein Tco_0006880 [Tanacetum coccineum]
MDTAYGRRGIRRIGNCLYAFSCEELALTVSLLVDTAYWVLRDLLLHRSSINNSASLAIEFKELRCDQQFSRDIIVLLNDNATSQSKQNFQSSSTTFITFQDFCLRQELLECMSVHDNDASESLQPSWGKCTLKLLVQLPGGVV